MLAPSVDRSKPPAQSNARSEMVSDELRAVVVAVHARFPDHPAAEVEQVVTAAYRHLQAGATVTAHLIPLTLNRSLRMMRESAGRTTRDTDAGPAGSQLRGGASHSVDNSSTNTRLRCRAG